MGHIPERYLVLIEEPKEPCWNQIKGYIIEVTVGSTKGATVPVQIGSHNVMLWWTQELLRVSLVKNTFNN